MPDGEQVEAMVLSGANGVSARVITLGATLQAFNVPDRDGKTADIERGYNTAAE